MATCHMSEARKCLSSAGVLERNALLKIDDREAWVPSPHPEVESPVTDDLQSTTDNPEVLSLRPTVP